MITRGSKVLFFLLILFLPSQLALHFWPSWTYISHLRVDYLSPAFYFTDLFILPLIFLLFRRFPVPRRLMYLISIFILLNILISPLLLAATFKWLRLAEYFALGVCLYRHRSALLPRLALPLSLSLLWTSFLALMQFCLQHSVGGLWTWLGERPLSVSTPLIAKISLGNLGLFMRPYATFSHPNALAGFLLLGFCLLLLLKPSRLSNLAILVSLLTLPLTFSRTAIFLELVFLAFYFFRRFHSWFVLPVFILPLAGLFTFGNPDSVPERLVLVGKSLTLILFHPVLGVGLNNFLPASLSLQPVHNVFLLLMSEIGLPVSLLIFFLLGRQLFRFAAAKQYLLVFSCLVVIFTSFLDHYWFTLPQNLLFLSVFISLFIIKSLPANDQ